MIVSVATSARLATEETTHTARKQRGDRRASCVRVGVGVGHTKAGREGSTLLMSVSQNETDVGRRLLHLHTPLISHASSEQNAATHRLAGEGRRQGVHIQHSTIASESIAWKACGSRGSVLALLVA